MSSQAGPGGTPLPRAPLDVALPLGLVDTKVAAIDATWSGPKLVVRRGHR
jgi:hypothetical protein